MGLPAFFLRLVLFFHSYTVEIFTMNTYEKMQRSKYNIVGGKQKMEQTESKKKKKKGENYRFAV